MARMLLVDGSHYAFRAHFAQGPRHTSDGFPTRVLYGFTLLFDKMERTWQPDYVAIAFDTSRNFRQEIFPAYKGHRPDMPEDLRMQWPELPKLVEAFGYTVSTMDGWEADDVLGTLASRYASEDVEVFLVTSDKDYAQLVGEHVTMLDDARGVTYDPDGVEDKFGVGPGHIIDMLALAGDSSDNVPGVSGVGAKTTVKYLQKYGDLEAVLAAAAAGEIGGKRGQALVDEADNARLSQRLVTIRTDVPIPWALDDLAPKGIQEDVLTELFDRWEFGRVARKLLSNQETFDVTRFTTATTAQAVGEAVAAVRDGTLSSFELATTDDGLAGVAFGAVDGAGVYVPIDAPGAREAVLEVLGDASVPKVGHATKAAFRALTAAGARLDGVTGDVRLLDYLLGAHRRTHSLEDVASRHLHAKLGAAKAEAAAEGGDTLAAEACERANAVAVLHAKLVDKMSDGQRWIYEHVELPLIPILAGMEDVGVRLDTSAIAGVEQDLQQRLAEVEQACHDLAGKTFNVRSRHELRAVLFDDLKLTPSKRVKDGWSTASSVLEKILDEHALPGKVLEYRSLDKLLGTYLTKLPGYVADDGRIHTTFNQAIAATGRLSSNDPNLQNIPVRSFEGRRIRACFVPADGHVFLSADYGQVELRVLAHFTEDPVLLEGFRAGEDIHRRTAVEIFGVDPDAVTLEQRSAAKAINFGLLYGMSAFRLSRDLGISRDEAQAYMDAYFARMPAVQGWIEATKESCREHGYVDTLFGRRRLIPEIHSKQFNERSAGEREAVNTRIQGTAADIIKLAMLSVDEGLTEAGVRARMVLQVHDELLLEVPADEVDAVTALVEARMQDAAELVVPLVVKTSVGATWEEAHG